MKTDKKVLMKSALACISELLQIVQGLANYSGGDLEDIGKIRFPRGYFKKVSDLEKEISFVENSNLKKNIAYALQYADLLKWVLDRFDIDFSVLSIHNKTGLVLLGSIAEGLLKGFKSECEGGFEKLINCFRGKKLISPELAEDLEWLKDNRNNIHLDRISIGKRSKEYDKNGPKYKPEDFKRGLDIIGRLIQELGDPPLQF